LDEEADVDIQPTTHTRWRGRVDPAGMAEVAALLLGAERPMLMVGDGIALADAQPEVVALAETAGLPVFECYASEFTMPASHPLNQGALNFVTPGPLRATLEGCDLLLVVGAPMFQLIFPEVQSPAPDARDPARATKRRAGLRGGHHELRASDAGPHAGRAGSPRARARRRHRPGAARKPGRPAGEARSQGRGHLFGRRGDVLDLGAVDGRPSSDPRHLSH